MKKKVVNQIPPRSNKFSIWRVPQLITTSSDKEYKKNILLNF